MKDDTSAHIIELLRKSDIKIKGSVTRDTSQRRFLEQNWHRCNIVATSVSSSCSIVPTLEPCIAPHRRCESFRVTLKPEITRNVGEGVEALENRGRNGNERREREGQEVGVLKVWEAGETWRNKATQLKISQSNKGRKRNKEQWVRVEGRD